MIIGGTLTSVNITTTNLTDTNISAGTLNASTITVTSLTASNLLASTSISAGAVYATNATATNVVATAVSAGSLVVTNQSITNSTITNLVATGNVGVGIANPSYKLHVSGDIYSTGDITSFSDMRFKTNVQQLSGCIEKVQQIRGITYTRIASSNNTEVDVNRQYIGFLAQEVEEQFPELISVDPTTGYRSVAYGNTTAVLVECIKELVGEVKDLKRRISDLEK